MRRVECSSSFDPFRALFTEVPRIWTLRRRVHKGKRKGQDTRYPAPLQQAYYYTTIAPAVDVKGAALASPTTSAQEALLGGSLSHSLGTPPQSIPADTTSGVVRTNANLEPSGAMNMSPCAAAIPKGDGACAIRLDRIRASEGVLTKNLPVEVT